MKLKELFEDTGLVDEIVETIEANCQPYLSELNGNVAYRGIKSLKGNEEFVQKAVRQDRKAKNSSFRVHDVSNQWMKDKFGYNARSETIFVTGSKEDARSYGTVHAIFPIGNFDFIWSPMIYDLFTEFKYGVDEDTILKTLEGGKYTNGDLAAAIESGHEIMIRCKDYYALPIRSAIGEEVLERLGLN